MKTNNGLKSLTVQQNVIQNGFSGFLNCLLSKFAIVMKYMLIPILVFSGFISCKTQQKEATSLIDTTVETQSGLLKGVINETNNVVSFKGVPYAAAPIGDLRWREPQAPYAWKGIRDASKFGPSAMQHLSYSTCPYTTEFMVQDSISEDCLFLNIWTPAKTSTDKLPVLVFIHGGGFNEGSGDVGVYDGEELAKKGIIVITINYRLLALGFMAHPELTAESPHKSSGNYGYLDQIAALKWVKTNIAAFGGNPDCVTVGGQSAGAGSVNRIICSPLASGLFHRAITQSGTSYPNREMNKPLTLKEAEKIGLEFAQLKGASNIKALRAMSAKDIITYIPNKYIAFRGNMDGYVQQEDMMTVFAAGKQNDTPFLTGLNADEVRYRGEQNKEFKALYPSSTVQDSISAVKSAALEQSMLSAYLWLDYRAKTAKTNGYVYYFDRAIPWPEHPEYGAFHSSEIPYVFNNMKKLISHTMEKKDTLIADKISAYWVNFVKSGDPNGPNLAKWEAFKPDKPEIMQLGEDFGMVSITKTKEKLGFLKKEILK